MTARDAEKLFEGPIAEEYELLKKICPAAADMSRRVGEFVGALPEVQVGRSVELFEIGTGTGLTSSYLLGASTALHLTGCDNSEAMLNQARQNLAAAIAEGRVHLLQSDALAALRQFPADSFDIIASGYTLHNFLDDYRREVLVEIRRTLKSGGMFVNGDRYAQDDPAAHLRLIQDEVRGYFRVFLEMGRPDLLEEWVVHLYSDESPHHIMRLGVALTLMRKLGFDVIDVPYRDGVNALVTARKPQS